MGQRSLHEYFSFKTNSPPPGLSFLNLPYHVGHRIYDLAGLLRSCPINLNLEGGSREEYLQLYSPDGLLNQPAKDAYLCFYWKHIHNEDTVYVQQAYYCWCIPLSLPLQLLYVSRAISDEVLAIFYS